MAATPRCMPAAFIFLLFITTAAVGFDVPSLTFSEGFSHLFGNDNLIRSADGRSARLSLNRYSGNPQPRHPLASLWPSSLSFCVERICICIHVSARLGLYLFGPV